MFAFFFVTEGTCLRDVLVRNHVIAVSDTREACFRIWSGSAPLILFLVGTLDLRIKGANSEDQGCLRLRSRVPCGGANNQLMK